MTRHATIMTAIFIAACFSVLGCDKKSDDKEASSSAQNSAAEAEASEDHQGGEEEASGSAADDAPATPEQAMAKYGEAMAEAAKQMKKAGMITKAKAVNWRKLAPLLPESVEGFKSVGDLKGKTGGMGGFSVSEVRRRYQKDKTRASIEIMDTAAVPMMRAGFAMALQMNEDSTEGVKKGVKVNGYVGFLEWRKRNKRSQLNLLVGERFVVKTEVRPTEDMEAAIGLAKQLKLDDLAKLK